MGRVTAVDFAEFPLSDDPRAGGPMNIIGSSMPDLHPGHTPGLWELFVKNINYSGESSAAMDFFFTTNHMPVGSLVGFTGGTIEFGEGRTRLDSGPLNKWVFIGGSITPAVSTTPVPEPSSLLTLLALGLAYLPLGLARKRARNG